MKYLNKFFIDCLIFYGVDLKQWLICLVFAYASTVEIPSCQGSVH